MRVMDVDKNNLEQILLMGQSPVAWVMFATSLRRAAENLLDIARKGDRQFWELFLKGRELPVDETGTRSLTQEESAAFVDLSTGRVSVLILAYAVENLIKANLAAGGHQVVNKEGNLRGPFKSHNLRQLANYADLEMSGDEAKLLDYLQGFLEWRGRYPIPASVKGYLKNEPLNLSSRREVKDRAFAMYDRILEITMQKLPASAEAQKVGEEGDTGEAGVREERR